jgi:hypothetical protein
MEKRESVRIFRNRQSRFVHQLADGEVCQQETIELLSYQFRSFAAQDNLTPPEMGLQFVKRGFDLPPFVIKRGQFFARRLERTKDRRHQPVNRFGVGQPFQLIVNDTNSYTLRFVPRIFFGSVDKNHRSIVPVPRGAGVCALARAIRNRSPGPWSTA